jgi:hypothetical protein
MTPRISLYWASSWSWVGHLLGVAGRWLGAPPPQRNDTVIVYADNPVMDYVPAIAIVFGNVINYRCSCVNVEFVRRYDDFDNCRPLIALQDHEYQHVLQYRQWGPAFIPAYLAAEVWARSRRLAGKPAVNWFERCADDRCRPYPRIRVEKIDLQGPDLES